MILRSTILCCALAFTTLGRGQSCFVVVDSEDQKPIVGCTVLCTDGTLGAISDRNGRICLAKSCARFEVRALGHMALSMSFAEAELMGQLQLTRVSNELPTITVEPWPRKQDRQALAANYSVDSTLLAGCERSSLRNAAQTAPGVQWDQRGNGGSQRLSIRGSLIRSTFGVRGVKVYWGPFPLTLADGSTPLEILDPLLVGSVDIVRSIGSPVFGSAPSGMLLTTAPFRNALGRDLLIEGIAGSYGYFRAGALARSSEGKNAITVGVVRQRNDGYRAQEWNAHDQAFATSRFLHKRGITQVFLTWQNASWALPGSIDSLTATNDPRSARPYSQSIDAHIEKQQIMGGIATELAMGKSIRIRSGVHAQLIDKKNPFGTTAALSGYKVETIRAAGARLSISGDHALVKLPISWEFGVEALLERDQLQENTYANAVYGDVKTKGDSRVGNLNAFALTTTKVSKRIFLLVGLGLERTAYRHNDLLVATEQNAKTNARPTPLLGLEYLVVGGIKVHLRYAESVNRPTISELLGSTGVFNTGLDPELINELEAGVHWGSDTTPARISLNWYTRRSELPITAVQTTESTIYRNEGRARQSGVEVTVEANSSPKNAWILFGTGSASAQVNSVSTADGIEYRAPGIPDLAASLLTRIVHNRGSALEIGWQGRSSARASKNLDASVSGSSVFHVRLSMRLGRTTTAPLFFVHVENLLDQKYTSWIQVNDPGGRYYNPAPGRSVFGGLRLTIGSKVRPTGN
ncbi:MAG: TonB-dependent receptor [Flavobacteriales bacterium]|nr:TonB-dependent receptor [Flavobacteriales bacterium]